MSRNLSMSWKPCSAAVAGWLKMAVIWPKYMRKKGKVTPASAALSEPTPM